MIRNLSLTLTTLALVGFHPAVLLAQQPRPNLLRNSDFQDDWHTLLPELKNHHWNYATELFNRRDYNPDGWRLSGKWQWLDADKLAGQRRLVMESQSRAVQTVNWVLINNPKKLGGWPDAGGYPAGETVRSKVPLSLMRDLTFRVRLSAKRIPAGVVKIAVSLSPASPIDDSLGTTKPIVTASFGIPAGTHTKEEFMVTLPARSWLEEASKDKDYPRDGATLPGSVVCEIAYAPTTTGQIEVHEATLEPAAPTAPNLLADGGFERVDAKGYPVGWTQPAKYRYFPPGIYYIFNTWHNSNSDNRGPVVADALVPFRGARSLKMIVATGDEKFVASQPISLNQTQPRLIEASAWIRTDNLAMLQIDAEDEKGNRLDGFNFIHKAQPSVGTNDWRLIRQVFRPSAPVKSIRLKLCARGMNGHTLDDTGFIPQQNAVGTIWWDDVRVFEPESTGATAVTTPDAAIGPHLRSLDLGERMIGHNELSAEIVSPAKAGTFRVEWEFESPSGKKAKFTSNPVNVQPGKSAKVRLPYTTAEPCPAYREYRGTLRLLDGDGKSVAESPHWFAVWDVPLDVDLGALYLRPEQKQFVRVNVGLSSAEMRELQSVKLDVIRRGTGQVLKSFTVPATLADIETRRGKIPDGVREDLRNLVMTDLDLSFLPLQPFADPQRNWFIRVTTIDKAGKPVATVDSPPFCRLGHDGPQAPIGSVRIDADGAFLVNGKPWMPWGVTYGHNPVYDGPADAPKNLDLRNLPNWGIYDRHGGTLAQRKLWDLSSLRHVEGGGFVDQKKLDEMWKNGAYVSTVFIPRPAPGKPWPEEHLRYLKTAPMVASVSPGPEEAFGYFSPMTPQQLAEKKAEADYLRKITGKPVMVGHGGYWNRLEFEKVPFYDIFDPETEPLYPAPLHIDMTPLIAGQARTVWLRPQMYEDVPFERWRYHVFTELMRGARGWQVAHGPGDASTFRGLHAELRHLQPAIYSKEKAPTVRIEPGIEHMVRQHAGKTTIIAATTHGFSFGNWRWADDPSSPAGRPRVSAGNHAWSDESNGYNATEGPPATGPCQHGVQWLTDPQKWAEGSKLTTWVKLDATTTPKSVVALVKCDGRWVHAGAWGPFELTPYRKNNDTAHWFLRSFYRHASGFLGWGNVVPPHCFDYIPANVAPLGNLPEAGKWVKIEVPLGKLGAAGKLLDGVAFLHDGGRAWWAGTTLVGPDGKEQIVLGEHEDRPDPKLLATTKLHIEGLKKGTKVRVLFEDREIVAENGYFVDDFRGQDLYQRFGGQGSGHGDAPVALHIYEVPAK